MKKQYAFLLMGADYDPAIHRAAFTVGERVTLLRTARDFPEAKEIFLELTAQGVGAVELCGAFGEEKARELMALGKGKVVVGYVQNFPEQSPLIAAFWG